MNYWNEVTACFLEFFNRCFMTGEKRQKLGDRHKVIHVAKVPSKSWTSDHVIVCTKPIGFQSPPCGIWFYIFFIYISVNIQWQEVQISAVAHGELQPGFQRPFGPSSFYMYCFLLFIITVFVFFVNLILILLMIFNTLHNCKMYFWCRNTKYFTFDLFFGRTKTLLTLNNSRIGI